MTKNGDKQLVVLDRLHQEIAGLARVEDVQDVLDQAEVIRVYAKTYLKDKALVNKAVEVKLRSARRGGELLREMAEDGGRQRRGGDRKSKDNDNPLIPDLDDLGVDKNDAALMRSLAYLPFETFERQIGEANRAGVELTTKHMLDLVREIRLMDRRAAKARESKARAETWEAGESVGDVQIHCARAQDLANYVEPGSAQLVITSPPYNVGIEYSAHDDVMTAFDYWEMIVAAFQAVRHALCDGGRIALVVPRGLGRSPYEPFADRMRQTLAAVGLTLEGSIIWDKMTTGNRTTWGSHRLPTAPRLRDRTEEIIIARNGSDSMPLPEEWVFHDEHGPYSPFLADADEFARLTQDVWQIRPETNQPDHPAPFPLPLVENLIKLYAYPTALIVDPFAGSGTTGRAAHALGCRAVLLDIDPNYCALMRETIGKV